MKEILDQVQDDGLLTYRQPADGTTRRHIHHHPPPRRHAEFISASLHSIVMLNLFQHLIPTDIPPMKEILDQVQDDGLLTYRQTADETTRHAAHTANELPPHLPQPATARHAELVSASLPHPSYERDPGSSPG